MPELTISFPVNLLTPSLNSKEQIMGLCQSHGQDLRAKFIENKAAFLYALAGKETGYGVLNKPKHEAAYAPGGLLYQKSRMLKELYRTYGAMISCSWSPWQIMAIVAIEDHKFFGHPAELHSATIAAPFVVAQLNVLISKGADTIEKLAASWNAGIGAINRPALWPKAYVTDFMKFFDIESKK